MIGWLYFYYVVLTPDHRRTLDGAMKILSTDSGEVITITLSGPLPPTLAYTCCVFMNPFTIASWSNGAHGMTATSSSPDCSLHFETSSGRITRRC